MMNPGRSRSITAIATLSAAAALVHASAAPEHFAFSIATGVFFVFLAAAQAAWAGVLMGAAPSRRTLTLGAAANAAVVLIWSASRTIGLPERESAALPDLLATGYEVLIVGLTAFALRRPAPSPVPAPVPVRVRAARTLPAFTALFVLPAVAASVLLLGVSPAAAGSPGAHGHTTGAEITTNVDSADHSPMLPATSVARALTK